MRRKPDRLVGYATIRREIIDISRSTFLRAVRAQAFGPATVVGGKRQIKVSERRVIAWRDAGGKPMCVLVSEHDQTQSVDRRPGDGRDNALARAGKLRPVNEDTPVPAQPLEGARV
jgi:hypothetical protein